MIYVWGQCGVCRQGKYVRLERRSFNAIEKVVELIQDPMTCCADCISIPYVSLGEGPL